MDRIEWGRRVVQVALERLTRSLAAELRLERCVVVPCGEWWRVTLAGAWREAGPRSAPPAPTADPPPPSLGRGAAPACRAVSEGSGRARWPGAWPPGDARARRRLELALAVALAELAQNSGAGLAVWRGHGAGRGLGPRTGAGRGCVAPRSRLAAGSGG